MTTLETLKAARKIIEDPAKWTQGYYAHDAKGNKVFANDEDAVCWCMLGAIGKVEGDKYPGDWAYETKTFGFSPVRFNDNHTHAEVLAAFDEAIARLEAK